MKKRVRLSNKQKVDIVEAYSIHLTPATELADKYGVTRQGIYKILKASGVDTTKKLIPVSCTVCGKILYRNKARIRRQLNHFCSPECYGSFLKAGTTPVNSRHGQRIARTIVSQHFQLQDLHVVHHESHNQLDNSLDNLRVFACQGDHIRYHHQLDVEPIWSGLNP